MVGGAMMSDSDLTYKVVKGVAAVALGAAAFWSCGFLWDRGLERYAGTGRKGSQGRPSVC